ncbi:MAG: PEGA domain-containing protein [Bryobacteraceae bacterium]|nr:PEGA domain-containing protein [Bryobacteraceae bacterium]
MTLDEAKDLVSAIKSGGLEFEHRVIDIIQGRGIGFFDEETNLSALRESGATDGVIAVIKKIAPPRPITTGTLALRCAPAECEITLNGKLLGTTTGGQLVLVALPAGEVRVDFAKEGYEPQQHSALVTAGGRREVSAALEPNSATREGNGKRLLALMLNALGMDSGAKDLPPLTGSGSITSYADGTQREWNFDLGFGSSTMIEMRAESSAGDVNYVCSGQRCSERKKGHFLSRGAKGAPPAVAAALETNLRAFAQYHLGPILQSLLAPSARLTASTADDKPQADQHLRVELSDSVYDLRLGPDLLPAEVEYESKMGLGSGLRILFGGYGNVTGDEKPDHGGVPRYPRHTTIRLPDSEKHGIEVKLDKVEPWTAFKASDFGK